MFYYDFTYILVGLAFGEACTLTPDCGPTDSVCNDVCGCTNDRYQDGDKCSISIYIIIVLPAWLTLGDYYVLCHQRSMVGT